MLDGRCDTILLDGANIRGCHHTTEVRIFRETFERLQMEASKSRNGLVSLDRTHPSTEGVLRIEISRATSLNARCRIYVPAGC